MSSNPPSGSNQQPPNVPITGNTGQGELIYSPEIESDSESSDSESSDSESNDSSGLPPPIPFIPVDAHMPDYTPVRWPRNLMPAKDANEGSWERVRYAPIWTDPTWRDDRPGQNVLGCVPNKDGIIGKVRPALLAKDQIWNPSEYAKRFGIFPGRIDGRSRTSPTKTESRKVFPTGIIRTGKDLYDHLEKLAAEKGQSLDEFMAREKLNTRNMDETDEACVRAYEDLLFDERWQGVLFGDLTMDQLHEEDYFTMAPALSDLKGPLHPFLIRSNWMDTRLLGKSRSGWRTAYNINGERGEYDPLKNDRVWEAMQPALQLASRLLSANDPFLSAIKDVTNRFHIDDSLDPRSKAMKRESPKFSFRSFVNMNDPKLVSAAREMRQVSGFDPPALSQVAMKRCIELSLQSGHYLQGDKFKPLATVGITNCRNYGIHNAPIRISIAAELVWPLLEPSFSSSERTMASYVIASTIAHEFMHAWCFSHLKWLLSPREYGISDPHILALCPKLHDELFPGRLYEEPSFEDDPVAEVGHAFEQHVLGGGAWPLNVNMAYRVGPFILGNYPGIAVLAKWPDSAHNGLPDNLTYPHIRAYHYNHFVRIGEVQRFFTEEFWQSEVEKYGMAAFRNPSKKPHKVFFPPENCNFSSKILDESRLGTRVTRTWTEKYFERLVKGGKAILESYLRLLLSEAGNFPLMADRFIKEKERLSTSEWEWLHTGKMVLMIVVEMRGFAIARSPSSDEQKLAGLRIENSRWRKVAASTRLFPDKYSKACSGGLAAFLESVRSINLSGHSDRLVSRLMDLVYHLEAEREIQESMLCELYRLPSNSWWRYRGAFDGHWTFARHYTRVVLKTLSSIMAMMNDISAGVPSWSGEWQARLQSLATAWKNIQRLWELDDKNVCKNWRDLLVTVPPLRKSRRPLHERLFSLAKMEMLNLSGKELEDLKKFKRCLRRYANLESYKIVLPEPDLDEQAMMQQWAGLLDDVMKKPAADPKPVSIFDTAMVKELIAKLRAQSLDTQDLDIQDLSAQELNVQDLNANKRKRGSELPATGTKRAKKGQDGSTLQQKAESDALKVPQMPPQFGRPSIPGHAVPFKRLQGSQAPSYATSSHAFAVYTSTSSLFPSQTVGQAAPWATNNPPQLAARANQLGTNKPPEPHPVGGIMPHPFATRIHVTKDLRNRRPRPARRTPAGSFAHEAPREGQSALGGLGPQGDGKLGDIDARWEEQGLQDEEPEQGDADTDQDDMIEITDVELHALAISQGLC